MGAEKEEQGNAAISGAKDHGPGVGGIRTTITKGDIVRRINFGEIDYLSWTPRNFLLKASNPVTGGKANIQFESNLELLENTEYVIKSGENSVEAYCVIEEFKDFPYSTLGKITFTTLTNVEGVVNVAGKFDFDIINAEDPAGTIHVNCPGFAVSSKV